MKTFIILPPTTIINEFGKFQNESKVPILNAIFLIPEKSSWLYEGLWATMSSWFLDLRDCANINILDLFL